MQVEAIRNLKIDKITVWDGGNGSGDKSSTAGFASSLIKSLPPLHEVAGMAGIDLPSYLGKMVDEPGSAKVPTPQPPPVPKDVKPPQPKPL